MRRLVWSSLDSAGRRAALARPQRRTQSSVVEGVRDILEDVGARGGSAVTDWSLKLDGAAPQRLAITPSLVASARDALGPANVEAIGQAAHSILTFHQAIRPKDSDWIETLPGLRSRLVWRPLESAGLYIPGGTAPLFSSLLMQALPARAAGVSRRLVMTPPNRTGSADPAMIVAAAESGLEEIWLIGGAQAIAAMTFGASLGDAVIEPVDKLFGPGNAWVAEAKKQASALPGGPAADLPAGPSELMIVADGDADPALVAADLLSQAEHDVDAQVLLVSDCPDLLAEVAEQVERQLIDLPRATIARAALSEGRSIAVQSLDEACEVANLYGPEHLALNTRDAGRRLGDIRAAGAVFLGRAAETLGDYVSGPSHVLPTDAGARAFSGITTASFMTSMSVQTVDDRQAKAPAEIAARLARLEGLEAHARAAEVRAYA